MVLALILVNAGVQQKLFAKNKVHYEVTTHCDGCEAPESGNPVKKKACRPNQDCVCKDTSVSVYVNICELPFQETIQISQGCKEPYEIEVSVDCVPGNVVVGEQSYPINCVPATLEINVPVKDCSCD